MDKVLPVEQQQFLFDEQRKGLRDCACHSPNITLCSLMQFTMRTNAEKTLLNNMLVDKIKRLARRATP